MGKGIALQFKKAFPNNFAAHQVACQQREVVVGRMFVFETGRLDGLHWIINFPTKKALAASVDYGVRANRSR